MGITGEKTRTKSESIGIRFGVVFGSKEQKHKKKGSVYTGTREEVSKNMKICVGGHKSSHEAELNDAAVGSLDS